MSLKAEASAQQRVSGLAGMRLMRRDWAAALLLAVVTLAVFGAVLGHRFIVSWDDSTAILTNPDYNPPGLGKLVHYWLRPGTAEFYVPVTYTLWGLLAMAARGTGTDGIPFNPAYFYAANLVFHAASAVMVYLVLRRLVSVPWAAWCGAALFAFHPMQVEAIASAWSVYTPLGSALSLFAIWQYLIYTDRISNNERPGAGWHYIVATIAFVLALLTKPTAASTPLIAGAIVVGLRGSSIRSQIIPMGIWLAMAAVVVWVNQRSVPPARVFVPDPLLRPMVALDAIAFYVGKVLLPIHLVMDYGRRPELVALKPAVRFTCLLSIALFVLAFAGRKKWPGVVTAFSVFVAGLLPSIGLTPFTFQYYSTVADRYVYLSMLGPAMIVAFVLSCRPGKAAMSGAGVILAGLATLSVLQLRHWRNDWTLAAYTYETSPHSAAGMGLFRFLLILPAEKKDATPQIPPLPPCSLDRATLMRVADIAKKQNNFELAAALYRQALAIDLPEAADAAVRAKELPDHHD